MNSLHNDILHSLISQAVLQSPLVTESELNKNEVLMIRVILRGCCLLNKSTYGL